HVGAADDGQHDRIGAFFRRAVPGQQRQHPVQQLAGVAAVLRGDRDGIAQAQLVKLQHRRFLIGPVAVDFVDGQKDGFFPAAQKLRHLGVQRVDAFAAVDDQDDHVGLGHGDLGLSPALRGDVFGGVRIDAARVDHREDAVAPAALAVEPIAGDAGLILHDRDPAPDEAVEQGRFAHVGPADQGDYGKLLHFKASLYSAFGLLYTTRGALASIAGVGPFPASVAHDDEIAVLQVVHDPLQNFRQQQRDALPLPFVVGREHRHAAGRVVFAQGDDGHDARSFRHGGPPLAPACSGGHSPDEAGLRTLPSSTGTYSMARIKVRSSRSTGTMAMTTSPVSGFWRATGRISGSSTSIFSPSSRAASWAMAWRCPTLASVARALAVFGRMRTAMPSSRYFRRAAGRPMFMICTPATVSSGPSNSTAALST